MNEAEMAYDRQKTCYEQNFEQFRSLNQTMWQVPIIGMTLTGGLWYGSASLEGMGLHPLLLLGLAVFADLGLVIVLTRMRYVMGCYLEKIKTFDSVNYVEAKGTWLKKPAAVALTFRILLTMCALVSIVAGILLLRPNANQGPATRRVIEVVELPR